MPSRKAVHAHVAPAVEGVMDIESYAPAKPGALWPTPGVTTLYKSGEARFIPLTEVTPDDMRGFIREMNEAMSGAPVAHPFDLPPEFIRGTS